MATKEERKMNSSGHHPSLQDDISSRPLLKSESEGEEDEEMREIDDDEKPRTTKRIDLTEIAQRVFERRGMLWGIFSGVTIAFEAILADLADDVSPPLQNSFYRCVVLLLAVFCISWTKCSSYDTTDIVLIMSFGLFEYLSTVCTFMAVKMGNIGDVTAIQANLPIPSSLLGCVLFGEVPERIHIFLLIVNAIGLIIVSKPPFIFSKSPSKLNFQWAAYATASVLLTALYQAVTRKLSYRGLQDSWLLLAMAGLIGSIGASFMLTFVDEWTLPRLDLSLLVTCFSLGIASFATLFGSTKGLETESMFTIGIMSTVSIPLTYVYQIVFDNTVPLWYTVVGAVLSISSTTCIYITSLT